MSGVKEQQHEGSGRKTYEGTMCVCGEKKRERGREKQSSWEEGASVTWVQSKWKVETVCNQEERWGVELYRKCIDTYTLHWSPSK